MYITTFETSPIDIIITGANLPLADYIDSLSYLNHIRDSWWACDDIDLPTAEYFGYYDRGEAKTSSTSNLEKRRGVLPIVYFKYGPDVPDSEKLGYSGDFIIDDIVFHLIDKHIAISKSVVGYSVFSHKEEKVKGLHYSNSELKNYLDKWIEKIKQKPVYKISQRHYFYFDDMEMSVGLPTVNDIKNNPDIPARFPYWLSDIKDKSTGYCATGSEISEAALSDENINVCPVLSVPFIPCDLKQGDIFEFQGRLFMALDNSMKGLSLNSIGYYPYSEKTCEKAGKKEDEHEFYLQSELHEELAFWLYKAKT